MNELSLFSGAGGGLLGTMLLGFRPIGYVEWDDYCQRVIAARIRDGLLPDAPIFGDIKAFIRDGYAHSYQGVVDVITAGFPCQPFSVAGKRKGAADERNQWPATATVIGIVRPRFCLLENVPGIRPYLPVVVRDLRRLGYEVSRPLILGADDVGAPHRRKRVWICANATGKRSGRGGENGDKFSASLFGTGIEQNESDRHASDAPEVHDGGYFREPKSGQISKSGSGSEPRIVSPDPIRFNGHDAGLRTGEISQQQEAEICRSDAANSDETGRGKQWGGESVREEQAAPECGGWAEEWPEVAARLCRVDDGVAHRVDRLKALGNGQVPQAVASAWRILTCAQQ